MTYQEALAVVVQTLSQDPALYPGLLTKLDKSILKRFVTPVARYPLPVPLTVNRLEASIFDNGESKAKRQRRDQDKCRWKLKLKLFKDGTEFRQPDWNGEALLRTPERALSEMEKLSKATKCLTPFSVEFRSYAANVIELASANDMLVGFLYQKPSAEEGGGTYFLDQHIVLVPKIVEVGVCADAMILMRLNGTQRVIHLPTFATSRCDGKPFTGGVVLQSRGTRATDRYTNWRTGAFRID